MLGEAARKEAKARSKRAYYERNREAVIARSAAWRLANPERRKSIKAKWNARNKGKTLAQVHKRNAKKKAAMPVDFGEFDQFVMQEAMEACKRREALHGIKFEMDHMIPLARGGLHAWHNIQVIPMALNRRKGDRMIYTKPLEWLADAAQLRN